MLFSEFVATRLRDASERSIEYKAINSFLSSLQDYEAMPLESQLRVWVASMIERGLTLSSRKRYIEKLNSLYREYCAETGVDDNPFDAVKELRTLDCQTDFKQLKTDLTRLEKIFDILLNDAKTRPELAIFLYLLFDASTDLEKAIYLTAEDYTPEFHQLNDVINISRFHHSRKYLFDLQQTRKRTPQLLREVIARIDTYFRLKDIKSRNPFTPKTIQTLWLAEARRVRVKLTDLASMFATFPPEFDYMRFLPTAQLTGDEQQTIRHRVAEAFSPSAKRWYAIKVRRSFDFDSFKKLIRKSFGEYYDEGTLFYPQKQVLSRVDKKIVTENIPVIPDVVFFRFLPRNVRKMDALLRTENLGWIFRYVNKADSDYSVIDSNSMALFQRMIGIFTPDMKIELTPEEPIGVGREVIITGGILEGYRGRIYDIKEGSDVRQIYIRLSEKYAIKAEAKVDEFYVRPLDKDKE